MPHPIIGERVRAARIAAHLTQRELANQDYSVSYISAIERAKIMPSLPTLQYLATHLDVSTSYLLGLDNRGNDTLAQERQARKEELVQLLGEAEQLLQQGRHEEAITLFEQIGRKDRASDAREAYARFLADQGRHQDAYEQMRRALH